jgi:adenylate cyclase
VVKPEQITTAASLLAALDHRGDDPEAAKAFDEAIWKARGAEAAMLVTDLSGFTRITKKHGILHFLAMFRRCQVACLPLLEKYGGVLLKQEADDFIAAFADVPEALHAALAMFGAVRAINEKLAEDDRFYMCVGIEFGTLLRLDDDAFGDAVNVAFKLGEDIAEPNEILLGVNAYTRARDSGFDFSRCVVDGPRIAERGNVPLEHYSIRLKEV